MRTMYDGLVAANMENRRRFEHDRAFAEQQRGARARREAQAQARLLQQEEAMRAREEREMARVEAERNRMDMLRMQQQQRAQELADARAARREELTAARDWEREKLTLASELDQKSADAAEERDIRTKFGGDRAKYEAHFAREQELRAEEQELRAQKQASEIEDLKSRTEARNAESQRAADAAAMLDRWLAPVEASAGGEAPVTQEMTPDRYQQLGEIVKAVPASQRLEAQARIDAAYGPAMREFEQRQAQIKSNVKHAAAGDYGLLNVNPEEIQHVGVTAAGVTLGTTAGSIPASGKLDIGLDDVASAVKNLPSKGATTSYPGMSRAIAAASAFGVAEPTEVQNGMFREVNQEMLGTVRDLFSGNSYKGGAPVREKDLKSVEKMVESAMKQGRLLSPDELETLSERLGPQAVVAYNGAVDAVGRKKLGQVVADRFLREGLAGVVNRSAGKYAAILQTLDVGGLGDIVGETFAPPTGEGAALTPLLRQKATAYLGLVKTVGQGYDLGVGDLPPAYVEQIQYAHRVLNAKQPEDLLTPAQKMRKGVLDPHDVTGWTVGWKEAKAAGQGTLAGEPASFLRELLNTEAPVQSEGKTNPRYQAVKEFIRANAGDPVITEAARAARAPLAQEIISAVGDDRSPPEDAAQLYFLLGGSHEELGSGVRAEKTFLGELWRSAKTSAPIFGNPLISAGPVATLAGEDPRDALLNQLNTQWGSGPARK